MTFTITIRLGNDAMQTTENVAAALEKTAEKIRDYQDPPAAGEGGRVMDVNGQSVGEWRFR